MQRIASTSIGLDLSGPARLIFAVAVAQGQPVKSETLVISVDGDEVQPTRSSTPMALDFIRCRSRARARPCVTTLSSTASPQSLRPGDTDPVVYLRPSRYCESDTLGPTAAAEFAGLGGIPLLQAVISWVNEKLTYVAGSSRPTDGAVRTLLARQGVYRDFAHLSVALLRSLNVPARIAAVYAPGLSPMEFHAVAEALVDGAGGWSTPLSWRLGRACCAWQPAETLQITAFLTALGAATTLTRLEVTAVVDDFQIDDTECLTQAALTRSTLAAC